MHVAADLFDGWNWDTHPVYFGYAAVLTAALWLVYRLLKTVERLTANDRTVISDRESAIPAQDAPSDGPETPLSGPD